MRARVGWIVGGSLVAVVGCDAKGPPARGLSVPPVVASTASGAAPATAASAAPCVARAWKAVTLGAGSPGLEPNAGALASGGGALRAACKTLEATNKRRRAAIYTAGEGPFGKEGRDAIAASTQFGCFAGAKGAWAIEQSAFRHSTAPAEPGEVATWTLVYLDVDGKRITSKDASGHLVMALGEGETTTQTYGTFDFDGDGVDEIFVSENSIWSIDGVLHVGYRGFRLRGGAIEAWDPTPEQHVRGWSDVDGDGRPDLVLDEDARGIALVAHSLPGGAFSQDDDVVRAVRHASCARKPEPAAPRLIPVPFGSAAPPSPEALRARAAACAPYLDKPCLGSP